MVLDAFHLVNSSAHFSTVDGVGHRKSVTLGHFSSVDCDACPMGRSQKLQEMEYAGGRA